VSGDVISKIAIYDEKIKIQRDNIDSARKALIQMDSAVDQLMSRTTDERGAEKAAGLRRQQAKERTNLQNDISKAQKEITALNDLRAPIAAEVRKVEAEVGPLKYIAAFIYGETNEGILERAVTWVIITIIIVFDPLAVIMLLAAQMTFAWMREQKQQEHTPDPYVADVGEKPTEEELKDDLLPTYEEITPKTEPFIPSANTFWPFPSTIKVSDHEQRLWDQSVANVGKDETPIIEELEKDTDFQPAQAEVVVTVDSTEHKVDEPKFQILPELEEESKKKELHDQAGRGTDSQDQGVTYVQNAEQGEETLWSRIQTRPKLKLKDQLYVEYSKDQFTGILINKELEPELYNFVEDCKVNGARFYGYDEETIEYFARRIYELRKNQSNNTAG
jgi:hypothetical protein